MADKIDKGFAVSYWKLSYRRKFIRTLWMIPLWIVALVLLYLYDPSDYFLAILVVAAIAFVIQLVYNYIKWKAEERNSKDITDCF